MTRRRISGLSKLSVPPRTWHGVSSRGGNLWSNRRREARYQAHGGRIVDMSSTTTSYEKTLTNNLPKGRCPITRKKSLACLPRIAGNGHRPWLILPHRRNQTSLLSSRRLLRFRTCRRRPASACPRLSPRGNPTSRTRGLRSPEPSRPYRGCSQPEIACLRITFSRRPRKNFRPSHRNSSRLGTGRGASSYFLLDGTPARARALRKQLPQPPQPTALCLRNPQKKRSGRPIFPKR